MNITLDENAQCLHTTLPLPKGGVFSVRETITRAEWQMICEYMDRYLAMLGRASGASASPLSADDASLTDLVASGGIVDAP